MQLPVELSITGADDDLVCLCEVNADGIRRDLSRYESLLRARFPITALVTDRNGCKWEAIFSAPNIQ
jgi:hypothetical protein